MPTAERDTPLDIQPYDHVPLSARTVLTGPDFSHPDFRAACEDPSDADFAFLGTTPTGGRSWARCTA